MNIIAISGSARKGSYNTALLRATQKYALQEMKISLFDISALPMYKQDDEAESTNEVRKFKNAIESSDGIIIATPEFNRSIPSMLKSAIDWSSRPYGDNSFNGKNVLILGASPGQVGTVAAQQHLRNILSFLNARVIGQPEFYLSDAAHKFDEFGVLTDESSIKFLTNALKIFAGNF